MAPPLVPLSLRVPGGAEAPRRARTAVLAGLGEHLSDVASQNVALVVSELVTNSVQHAAVGPTQYLGIHAGVLGDSVLIAVSDLGSPSVPRMTSSDPETARGLGLLLVDRLARSWGVARDGAGNTRVWCELALRCGDG